MRGKCGSAEKWGGRRRSDLFWLEAKQQQLQLSLSGGGAVRPGGFVNSPMWFLSVGEIGFLWTRFTFVQNLPMDLCLCEFVRASENLAASHASLHPSQQASSSSVCCLSPWSHCGSQVIDGRHTLQLISEGNYEFSLSAIKCNNQCIELLDWNWRWEYYIYSNRNSNSVNWLLGHFSRPNKGSKKRLDRSLLTILRAWGNWSSPGPLRPLRGALEDQVMRISH